MGGLASMGWKKKRGTTGKWFESSNVLIAAIAYSEANFQYIIVPSELVCETFFNLFFLWIYG